MPTPDYTGTMQQAEQAMRGGDYAAAEKLLWQAHELGHAVKADHMRAHRALVRLAVLRRKPVKALTQSGLAVLAWIFV
jgi:hypothetical protein